MKLERRVARLLAGGDSARIIEELDAFLARNPPSASASAALSYRAQAREDIGDYAGAWEDEKQAHALSEPNSYSRYTLELSLAGLSGICGHSEETIPWLMAALTTARDGDDISGAAALRKLLQLRPESELNQAERALCLDVIHKSWVVLRQPGQPDVGNLQRVAQQLVELGSKNRPRT